MLFKNLKIVIVLLIVCSLTGCIVSPTRVPAQKPEEVKEHKPVDITTFVENYKNYVYKEDEIVSVYGTVTDTLYMYDESSSESYYKNPYAYRQNPIGDTENAYESVVVRIDQFDEKEGHENSVVVALKKPTLIKVGEVVTVKGIVYNVYEFPYFEGTYKKISYYFELMEGEVMR